MTETGAIRRRTRRAVGLDVPGEETPKGVRATKQMRELAEECYRANLSVNAYRREADKARETLYVQMREKGVNEFTTTITTDSGPLSLNSEITAPNTTVIDIKKLKKLVSPEVFLQVISATVGKVDEFAGKDITRRCSILGKGKENVSIKAVKAKK